MAEIRTFYYDGQVSVNQLVLIQGNDFHHIRNVLRLQENDLIVLLTTDSKYQGKIVSFSIVNVQILILKKEETKPFLPIIHLIQGLPKGWKMDEIIEKSTEMGVSTISPVYMDRSIPRLSADEEKNKAKRWEKIAIAASKQSRRNNVPAVFPLVSFEKKIQSFDSFTGSRILCWELEQRKSLLAYLQTNHVTEYLVVIGPEGGISYEEVKVCEEHDFTAISLGDTILRTETAAPFSIGLIAYLWNTA